jgi:disulfide bond formation protein DsbB
MSVLSLPVTRLLTRLSPPVAAALVLAAAGVFTILGAYFFQFVLGYAPCPLCLEQRIPYYIAVPFALLVAAAARNGAPREMVRAGLGLLVLTMLIGAGLAAYHAGVEWKFWPGPQDCSGPIRKLGSATDLLQRMQQTSIVSCDEAAWRFLGLSLAGYNVLISLALAAIAAWGAVEVGHDARGDAAGAINRTKPYLPAIPYLAGVGLQASGQTHLPLIAFEVAALVAAGVVWSCWIDWRRAALSAGHSHDVFQRALIWRGLKVAGWGHIRAEVIAGIVTFLICNAAIVAFFRA